ncbi:MAG: hypothetical protein K6A40_00980 [Solobacterium sp.]|nr:hypothetical protein [Solobacterium sp.]
MKNEQIWNDYIRSRTGVYEAFMPDQIPNNLISEANWMIRCRCRSSEDLGFTVQPGDICFLDYGQAYLNEAGYQHFGLVLALCMKKALIIPMTSNAATYQRAYDPKDNPNGKRHLMRLGDIEGLNKPSVLFLNDMKFINTARVIRITAHIPVSGTLFLQVKKRLRELIRV